MAKRRPVARRQAEDERTRDRVSVAVALALAAGVLLLYGRTAGFGFITIDDGGYVYQNPVVQHGLTWDAVKWSFTTYSQANWHPLTWISYLVSTSLFGTGAASHHLVNVVIHALSAALLCLVLAEMTGSLWRSAVVAGIFAFHPTHVESVAWVAERKDVLSALFWILTTYCYYRYARLTDVDARHDRARPSRRRWYVLTIVAMALGVLAKPMIVTLPFTLLLLDYWPLRRAAAFDVASLRPLLFEKAPLFVLSAISSVVTVIAQDKGGAIATLTTIPLVERLGNVIVAYARYVGALFYPVNLGLVYEYQPHLPFGLVLGSLLLMVAISVFAVRERIRRPYLIVGWCWFVGTLVPVIGLLQVGMQSMADRYTYLPFVGLGIAVVWFGADLLERFDRRVSIGLATASLAIFAALTAFQLSFWNDAERLYRHTIAVTGANAFIEQNLCLYYVERSRNAEAEPFCTSAIAHRPNYSSPYKLLGLISFQRQDYPQAEIFFRQSLDRAPRDFGTYSNLAKTLLVQEKLDDAREMSDKMLPSVGSDANAKTALVENYTILGLRFAGAGRYDAASDSLRKALDLKGPDADLEANLGFVLYRSGKRDEGLQTLRDATAKNPDRPESHNMLGSLLVDAGRRDEAIQQFEQAIALKPDYGEARKNLEKVQARK